MRGEASDIGRLLVFDTQQPQHASIGVSGDEGNACKPKEARRIRGPGEVFRESRFDEIEVWLGARRMVVVVLIVVVRRLPLRHPCGGVVPRRRA